MHIPSLSSIDHAITKKGFIRLYVLLMIIALLLGAAQLASANGNQNATVTASEPVVDRNENSASRSYARKPIESKRISVPKDAKYEISAQVEVKAVPPPKPKPKPQPKPKAQASSQPAPAQASAPQPEPKQKLSNVPAPAPRAEKSQQSVNKDSAPKKVERRTESSTTEKTAPKRKKPAAPAPVAVPASESQRIAQAKMGKYGWSGSEFTCLVNLWQRESNWNHLAENPSSGAYGIPQSLPGNKMASHGADWRTNPATQIAWGLDYIAGRYGSPCKAWEHSETVGWY